MAQPSKARRPLICLAVVTAIPIAVLTWVVFEPVVTARTDRPVQENRIIVPDLDVTAWRLLPVQEGGRIKPLESACEETVREITGRARFEGHDPVAVVLMWRCLGGTSRDPAFGNWETYPFILCPDRDLRETLYRGLADPGEALTQEQLHGKYVSPEELRKSKAFWQLLREAEEIELADRERAGSIMSQLQHKAREVFGRLTLFDNISQNHPPQWANPRPWREADHPDPLHFVILDHVASGGWFSLWDMGRYESEPTHWQEDMRDRLSRSPQLYIDPERQKTLSAFQQKIKSGQGGQAIDELQQMLHRRDDERLHQFQASRASADTISLTDFVHSPIWRGFDSSEKQTMVTWLRDIDADKMPIPVGKAGEHLRDILAKRTTETISNLRMRLPADPVRYRPEDPRYRMLHLDYLESYYPDLYPESAAWQPFPAEAAGRVLTSFDAVAQAYKTRSARSFTDASSAFFGTVRSVSNGFAPYPGTDTVASRLEGLVHGVALGAPGEELIRLETQFNQAQPFHWAWILMLLGALAFGLNVALGSRWSYALAWMIFLAAIGCQIYGYFVRIVLAGRPPVSSLYETVIWVAFMSSVFACVLELIYRRAVIGLAGSLVSTLGLVMADQLPLALNPQISPLLPVLRSNYWLTIHVLTIVSSYAAGTLAWGLGNVSLGLLAFGSPSRDLLKTLARFTYRALQIAVLLLAAGTFLGGWWATESWGRFWGWDPKEVWALIALVCYVIPLHARYIGWVKDFGLAVSAVACYAAIVMSWYGANFILGGGLHAYASGGGGPWWIFWAGLINIEWVILASLRYLGRAQADMVSVP
jgi:ABC-type transport system involved in cytochrome c biogenesis permease subunit